MNHAEAPYKVPMDESELEFLINKKNEDTARQFQALRFLIMAVVIVSVVAGIGMFIITRLAADVFSNAHKSVSDILLTCLKLMLGLLCVMGIGAYYSYHKTLKQLIKDIKGGQQTIEPCTVIRKFYAKENNTYHVYITSTIRLSIEVTADEYRLLNDGDKINIAYTPHTKIFFGYFIE